MLGTQDILEASIWALLHLRTLLLAAVTFLLLADYLKTGNKRNTHGDPATRPS